MKQLILALALAMSVGAQSQNPEPVERDPSVRYVKAPAMELYKGQFAVDASGYYYVRFSTDGVPKGEKLSVTFRAKGGIGNDIVAAVMPATDMDNWVNGHSEGQRFCYKTAKLTFGDFTLTNTVANFFNGPGDYVVVFDNRFSPLSAKSIVAWIRWDDPEPPPAAKR